MGQLYYEIIKCIKQLLKDFYLEIKTSFMKN